MKALHLAALLVTGLFGLWSAPAAAQGPTVFYCYAQDGRTGKVYISDLHDVGPISERAGYGAEFSRFLSGKGKVPAGTQAYCTMHAGSAEAERGAADLIQYCSGCHRAATKVEPLAWPRGGKTLGNLLAGKVEGPGADAAADEAASSGALADEPFEGAGVNVLGRLDETDIVYTVNEENGATLARLKADLRGGKWTTILSNDRCPGWFAVAYAESEAGRSYFFARGAADEGEASRNALAQADRYAGQQAGDWRTGVLIALLNAYRAPGLDLSGGVIQGVKGKIRGAITKECGGQSGIGVGVRG